MTSQIILSVVQGPLKGKVWTFHEHNACLIGRHSECLIRVPDDAAHKTISRHHALLELAPPMARLRDFGSLNGTYVNGEKIGSRPQGTGPEAAAALNFPERELRHGDQIRVGDTVFAVDIQAPKPGSFATPKGTPRPSPKAVPNPQAPPQASSLSHYEILEELGRGGMGQVFLARDRRTREKVALKVMLPRVASDERARAVFLREIALTKALKHRNVVAMHDFGNDGDKFFFTLEFCQHGSLQDWIVNNDGVSFEEALAVTFQVLDGLDYLSRVPLTVTLKDGSKQLANGVVHRDLKPGNVLMSKDDQGLVAKIADVGLSKAFDTAGLSGLTMTGNCCGTPVFMPRQQIINYKFSKPEVDVWAAAAMLYWMLTAETPRDFPNRVDPFKIVLSSEPIPVRARNPDVPRDIAAVIDRALKDKPSLHYKSARDLRNDLRAAVLK